MEKESDSEAAVAGRTAPCNSNSLPSELDGCTNATAVKCIAGHKLLDLDKKLDSP